MYCPQCEYNNPTSVKFCKNCELDLYLYPEKLESVNPAYVLEQVYAGFWVRVLAAVLDLLVLGTAAIWFIFTVTGFVAFSGRENILYDPTIMSMIYSAAITAALSYYLLLESSPQSATLGKRWLNIGLRDQNGSKLSMSRTAIRLLAKVFCYLIFQIGFLIQPFTPRKQAVHDLLTHTIVIRTHTSKKISLMATLVVLIFALSVPALALMSTVGLPIIQQHILKVQLENGIKKGSETTQAVARFYHNNGRVPLSSSEVQIGLSVHVAAIEINQRNGETTIIFSNSVRPAIRNRHLIFSPTREANQVINWKCHSNDIETQYFPTSCK